MEVLAVVIIVMSLVWLGVSFAFLSLVWSTLKTHRRAMDSLHQKIERERLAEQQRQVGGTY